MSYSIISILALILNLIINREPLKNIWVRSGEGKDGRRYVNRYSFFLATANCYFITDIAWGLLYEHRYNDVVFPILYLDCVLYFLFMFLTMLTWMRYIVAYLDKRGRRSKVMLYAGWAMFSLALINLMINFFHPFVFSFNA